MPVRPARHGQGPVWDDGAGELLWVDAAGWIRWARVGPAGAVSDLAVRPVGEPVGAVALTTAPGWLLAAGSGFRRLTPDGEVGVLLDLDGVVSIALTDLEEPAAIAWSPDDDVLYLADSGARTVTAYDYDPDLGTADRPRVLLDFPMDEPAIPSGLTVDRAGHLWVSLTGGGQVRRYSSAGRPEEVVRVPVTQPTGCTFVGPALDVLVVTTAVEGLSDVDRVVQPDAGRLFTVHVPDVVGRGTFRYRGPLGGLTAA
jgi:sugar lactone lactonase YvrE